MRGLFGSMGIMPRSADLARLFERLNLKEWSRIRVYIYFCFTRRMHSLLLQRSEEVPLLLRGTTARIQIVLVLCVGRVMPIRVAIEAVIVMRR